MDETFKNRNDYQANMKKSLFYFDVDSIGNFKLIYIFIYIKK